MRNDFHDIRTLIRYIAARFVQDRCAQTASSLTFTTLLALVPMITIALTVFSAFPVFVDFSAQIKTYLLNNLMPENAGVIITQYMQQFADSAARLTAVGIVILTATAMMMLLTIDKAFNVIWQVTRPRPLVKRLVAYWAVLTLAPLLIGASLSLTSWLVGISLGHAKYVSPFGVVVLKVLPVLFARARVVDRNALEMRQLRAGDRAADLAGDGDHRVASTITSRMSSAYATSP